LCAAWGGTDDLIAAGISPEEDIAAIAGTCCEDVAGRSLASGEAGAAADHGGERIVSPWHNSKLPCDVNDDGAVDENDAKVLLAFLNTYGTQSVPSPAVEDAFLDGETFLDVDGDGTVQPLDLLRVINAMSDGSRAGEAAEQEGLPWHNPDFPSDVDSGGAMGDADAAGLLAFLDTYGAGPVPAAAPAGIAARTAALLDGGDVVPSLDLLRLIDAHERQDDASAQGSEGEKLPGDADGLADFTQDGAFGVVAPLAGIWR